MKKANKQILIAVTGGIGAYKACDLVRDLMKKELVFLVPNRKKQEFVWGTQLIIMVGNLLIILF